MHIYLNRMEKNVQRTKKIMKKSDTEFTIMMDSGFEYTITAEGDFEV